MANLKLIGRVTRVNYSNGNAYVTFLDTVQGGLIDLTIPGANGLQVDQKIDLDAEIVAGRGKYGMYLKVEKINKQKDQKEE